MHLFESVYYTTQSCLTTNQLWKTLVRYMRKRWPPLRYTCLCNLWMKQSNSIQAQLNKYESINSHISAQGMKIDDELKALLFISSLNPLSCEKFVTTVRNVSATTIKYSEITSSILLEDTSRKTFVHESRSDAYV